jgi:hypothetical protein
MVATLCEERKRRKAKNQRSLYVALICYQIEKIIAMNVYARQKISKEKTNSREIHQKKKDSRSFCYPK